MAEEEMKQYVGMRENLLTMNATMTFESAEYAKITTAHFASKGTITLLRDGQAGTTYNIHKKKPYHGLVIANESGESEHQGIIGRAWRNGILSKSMHIVLEGVYYRMTSMSFLKNDFEYYKICDFPFDSYDEDNKAADDFVKDKKDEQGVKIGTVQKDGLFKKTYTVHISKHCPDIFPPLALWLSTMFERQDSAVVGGAGAGAGAGAF